MVPANMMLRGSLGKIFLDSWKGRRENFIGTLLFICKIASLETKKSHDRISLFIQANSNSYILDTCIFQISANNTTNVK